MIYLCVSIEICLRGQSMNKKLKFKGKLWIHFYWPFILAAVFAVAVGVLVLLVVLVRILIGILIGILILIVHWEVLRLSILTAMPYE